MNRKIIEEVERLGGDVSSHVWRWFLRNGPHGNSFTWGQTRNQPPGYVGLEHLQRIVAGFAEKDKDFISKALRVAQSALASNDPGIVRRGIQVIGVVGGKEQLDDIKTLSSSLDPFIAEDARACLFELKRRIRDGLLE
jgi:hypothetical protein